MFRNWQLATALAIAISAWGTIGSVQAGGFGNFGGGGGRGQGGGQQSGGFKPSSSRIVPSGGNVIRSGNLGGIQLGSGAKITPKITPKPVPKNTGVVPPVVRTGGTNTGGIKLPGVGSSNKGPVATKVAPVTPNAANILKNISNSKNSTVQSKVLGGLGIAIGSGNGPGAGKGQGGGSGGGKGNGHGHHDHHGHDHHHHGHHHHCPPIVLTLPVCSPNYCPPPCPPIYYPQPVPVPVAEPFPVPVPVEGPAVAPAGGEVPQDTKQVETVAAEAPVSDTQPTGTPNADVVSNEVPLPQVPIGATLTLNGKDLSDKPGQVVLQLGEIALPATIKEWKNDSVVCSLPVLGLTKPSKATLHVLKADGKTASTMNLELVTSLPTSLEAAPVTSRGPSALDASKYDQ
jgi:hypothetical protein